MFGGGIFPGEMKSTPRAGRSESKEFGTISTLEYGKLFGMVFLGGFIPVQSGGEIYDILYLSLSQLRIVILWRFQTSGETSIPLSLSNLLSLSKELESK